MTAFDYAALIIVGLSILLSVIRGLVREVLALLAWVVALVAANLYSGTLAAVMPQEIPGEQLRFAVGFVAAFFGVLLVMSLIAIGASRLVKSAGLGVEDRMLGAVFGAARGALVVLFLVLLAGLTTLPKEPVWREAFFRPPLQAVAEHVKLWLPGEWSKRIKYD